MTAIGTGNMEQQHAQESMSIWRSLANILPPVEKQTEEEKVETLRGMGITVD